MCLPTSRVVRSPTRGGLAAELMPRLARSRALILSRPAVVAALAVAFALVLGTTLLTAFRLTTSLAGCHPTSRVKCNNEYVDLLQILWWDAG